MDQDHPAFVRLPPWAKAKLLPQAIETIKKIYEWVETECIPAESVMKA